MKTRYVVLFVAAGVVAAALVAHPQPAAAMPPAHVALAIVAGVRLGPDGKMHDAFTPSAITALVGQRVIVTVYNYDLARHSFTAPALRLNVLVPAARRSGVPSVTIFTFRVGQAGVYHWRCKQPCDSMAKGWAMLHDGYMAGTISIVRA